ncbi:hypothetical protein JCM19238_3175 [Vibrio ponticus]|nr:hypothetical protein JCM19238_3175 [Vibrio ponticus]
MKAAIEGGDRITITDNNLTAILHLNHDSNNVQAYRDLIATNVIVEDVSSLQIELYLVDASVSAFAEVQAAADSDSTVALIFELFEDIIAWSV